MPRHTSLNGAHVAAIDERVRNHKAKYGDKARYKTRSSVVNEACKRLLEKTNEYLEEVKPE